MRERMAVASGRGANACGAHDSINGRYLPLLVEMNAGRNGEAKHLPINRQVAYKHLACHLWQGPEKNMKTLISKEFLPDIKRNES